MAKENDPLADYFPSPEEEYSAYKKRKREKEENEKREKAKMERQDSDDDASAKATTKEGNDINRDFNVYDTSLSDDECEEINKFANPYVAYRDYMITGDFDAEEEMSDSQPENEYNLDELAQRNKVVKSLLDLKNELGDDIYSEEVEKRINEIGIYKIDSETLSLQKAVDFSRKRVKSYSKITMRIYQRDQDIIEDFLASTYNMSEIAVIFHRLSYPEDYQFVNSNWSAEFDEVDNIAVGVHTEDYRDVDLDDPETWPVHNIADIDIDVEFEINFQKALASLRKQIGNGNGTHIDVVDVGLRIPYSQISKATTYEIRLIKLLVELNYIPRVSVCIFKNDMDEDIRACAFITYLKLHKFSD